PQRLEATVLAFEAGPAQADRLARARLAVDDRPVPRPPHFDRHRLGVAHADRFAALFARLPALGRAAAVFSVELFDVEVLRIGHAVGDIPGDAAVVAEMRKAGRAGE